MKTPIKLRAGRFSFAGELQAFEVRSSKSEVRSAFSLIEIMVTVGLLSFIILGLVAMFSQTQRAFTTSMAQVDVLESGRAMMEMLSRELSEVAPSHRPFTANMLASWNQEHFPDPLYQVLHTNNPTALKRTNVIDRVFFLTRMNQAWTGIGYEVRPLFANAGVGALYRFSETTNSHFVGQLSAHFVNALRQPVLTNRLAEGIVHFRVIPIAANGFPLTSIMPSSTNAVFITNSTVVPPRYKRVPNTASSFGNDPSTPELMNMEFYSNAVPAFVDLEVGILEPQALERFKSFGNASPTVQREYLEKRVGQVHLFRQRIPIRNVDLSVYQ